MIINRKVIPLLVISLPPALVMADSGAAVTGAVSAGAGYLDTDSFRHGKYSGLTEEGGELVLDLELQYRDAPDSGDTGYWRIEGERLGLDSRRLEAEAGYQGRQRLRLDYRETPKYLTEDAVTPYGGRGSSALSLPGYWQVTGNTTADMPVLDGSLNDFNVRQKRRNLALEYQHRLGPDWVFEAEIKRETRDGRRVLGGLTGTTGGNPRAALLPAPVDFETTTVDLSLARSGDGYHWGLDYHGSFFRNDDRALTWPTAFGRQPQWAEGTGFPDGINQLALEPDNDFHQLRAHGSTTLGRTTRLHLDAAIGRMLQDQRFLSYTLNPQLDDPVPLPRRSLDGRVDITTLNLRLTSRPLPQLNLVSRLRYRDRDNRTPRNFYQRVRNDAENQQTFDNARVNRPYSMTTIRFSTDAAYRLSRAWRLQGGYEYTDIDRDYSEVNNSQEHGINAGVRYNGLETMALTLDYSHQQRRANRYVGNRPYIETHVPGTVDAEDFENHPLLRKYYLSNRNRDQLRLRGDFFLWPELNLGLSAAWNRDDYRDSTFGLNDSDMLSYTLDASYVPSEQVRLSAFVTIDRYKSEQSSRSFRGFSPPDVFDPDRNWQVDAKDRFETLGISFDLEHLQRHLGWLDNRLDVGIELVHSRSRGDIDVDVGPALEAASLPELYTRLNSLRLNARYHISDRASLGLALEHERYRSRDFAFDGVAPNEIANVLTLGHDSPDYRATWTTVSYRYRF